MKTLPLKMMILPLRNDDLRDRPSYDLDDEEEPQPNVPGWEHSYAANGQSGQSRNPIREPKASHVYFVVRAGAGRDAAVVMQVSARAILTTM